MAHTITVLGDWVLKNIWHFTADQTKGSKVLVLEDDMSYDRLVQIVEEEYQLDSSVHNIQLSYVLPEILLRNMPIETPPVFLTSDRQVKNYIDICKSNSVRLCVSVKTKAQENNQVSLINELFATSGENRNVQIADGLFPTSGDIRNHGDLGDDDKDNGGDNNILSSNNTDIKVGEYFKSKYELQQRLWMLSVKYKFGWRVSKSDTKKLVVVCKNNGCSWRVRATTKDETTEYFWIRKYIDVHTCSAEDRSFALGSITPKVIGQLILDLFGGISKGLKPRDLEKPLLKNYGLTLTYHQLYDALQQAQELMRGSPESGYEELPKYIYKIKKANPGTIAELELEGNQRFKYLFFAFGQSLRGFEFMRKVIVVDGTFLKGKFRGTLIVATAQDGDNHIYPIAFGIVDSENDAAWEWFFCRLKSVIPDHPNLVFISDRHESIEKAIEKVFPSANRGICFFHLEKNITTKFRANPLFHLVKKAGNTYRRDDFNNVMDEIRRFNPKLSKYLEDADIRLWSTAHFQGNRYNITTTNIAESINGLLKEAREFPIVAFLDHVRATLTRWFCERRQKAAELVTVLVPYANREIEKIREEANTLAVQPINLNQFHVTGGSQDAVVDMQKLSCSCRAFDIMKIPCKHAIAVATKKHIPEHTLSDPCYTRTYLFAAYSESIYPVEGILNDIQIPPEIEKSQCLPPKGRRRSGRPTKKRIQSSLEIAMENKRPRKEHKCSRCKLSGHNKSTCETALP